MHYSFFLVIKFLIKNVLSLVLLSLCQFSPNYFMQMLKTCFYIYSRLQRCVSSSLGLGSHLTHNPDPLLRECGCYFTFRALCRMRVIIAPSHSVVRVKRIIYIKKLALCQNSVQMCSKYQVTEHVHRSVCVHTRVYVHTHTHGDFYPIKLQLFRDWFSETGALLKQSKHRGCPKSHPFDREEAVSGQASGEKE